MPPQPKYSKEEILNIAFETVRKNGYNSLTARDLAASLGTSTRPIFTAFENMDQLKNEILIKAYDLFEKYKEKEINSKKYPLYKATGMAYIRFAKEEKNIFKLLFMRDRSKENPNFNTMSDEKETEILTNQLSISNEKAEYFHTEMWIWVHGVATMIATSYLDWDFELISKMLTDMYNGLKRGTLNE